MIFFPDEPKKPKASASVGLADPYLRYAQEYGTYVDAWKGWEPEDILANAREAYADESRRGPMLEALRSYVPRYRDKTPEQMLSDRELQGFFGGGLKLESARTNAKAGASAATKAPVRPPARPPVRPVKPAPIVPDRDLLPPIGVNIRTDRPEQKPVAREEHAEHDSKMRVAMEARAAAVEATRERMDAITALELIRRQSMGQPLSTPPVLAPREMTNPLIPEVSESTATQPVTNQHSLQTPPVAPMPPIAGNPSRQIAAAVQQAEPVPRSLTPGETLKSAAGSFAQGLASAVAGVPEAIAITAKQLDEWSRKSLDGSEEFWGGEYEGKPATELTTYKLGQWIRDKAKEYFPTDPRAERDFIAGTLAQGAGNMAGFMVGGALGKGSKAMSMLASGLIGGATMGSEEYRNALETTGDHDKAWDAFIENVGWGATEAIPIGRVLDRLDKATHGEFRDVMTAMLVGGWKGAAEEGIQEAVQQVGSNWSAQRVYDAQRSLTDGTLEGALAGAILGGVLGGGTSALGARRGTAPEAPGTETATGATGTVMAGTVGTAPTGQTAAGQTAAGQTAAPVAPIEGAVPQIVGQNLPPLDLETGRPTPSTAPSTAPPTEAPVRSREEMTKYMQIQQTLLEQAGIPEEDIPDYVQDSVAAGAVLGEHANKIIAGEESVEDAIAAVKRDYEKMVTGKKEAPNLQEEPETEASGQSPVREIALEKQEAAGWKTEWPMVPADLANANVREALANDPGLSEQEKAEIFDAGVKLGAISQGDVPVKPTRAVVTDKGSIAAGQEVAIPTDKQKESGTYKKAHVGLHGLDISIENPRGSVRSGVDQDGERWETVMAHDYGYIRGTEGKDKDHVDVFIGPDIESEKVFVVNQKNEKGGFDEHKIMLGFNTQEAAEAGYLENYDTNWLEKQGGSLDVAPMTVPEMKQWLKGDTKKPAAPPVKTARYEAGKNLKPEERKEVLKTVGDSYKELRAPKVQKGIDARGEEIWGYVYNPEYMHTSDITGRKIRHSILLPDGRRAHPSELYPNITQADVEKAMLAEEAKEERRESRRRRMLKDAEGAKSVAEANKVALERGYMRDPNSTVVMQRDDQFIRISDPGDIEILENEGFKAIIRNGERVAAPASQAPDPERAAEDTGAVDVRKPFTGQNVDKATFTREVRKALRSGELDPVDAQKIHGDEITKWKDWQNAREPLNNLKIRGRSADVYRTMDGYEAVDKKGDVVRRWSQKEYEKEITKREKLARKGKERVEGMIIIDPDDLKNLPALRVMFGKGVGNRTGNSFEGVRVGKSFARSTPIVDTKGKETWDLHHEWLMESDDPVHQSWLAQGKDFDDIFEMALEELASYEPGKPQEPKAVADPYADVRSYLDSLDPGQFIAAWQTLGKEEKEAYMGPDYEELDIEDLSKYKEVYFGGEWHRIEHDPESGAVTLKNGTTLTFDRADPSIIPVMGTSTTEVPKYEVPEDVAVPFSKSPVIPTDPEELAKGLAQRLRNLGASPNKTFVGEASSGYDQHQLSHAKDLLASGVDSESVRKETGWFQGKDGKWRYEISDRDATIKPRGFTYDEASGRYSGKLGDILDHPALYAAYPDLADINIVTTDTKGKNSYSEGAKRISLSEEVGAVLTDYFAGRQSAALAKLVAQYEAMDPVKTGRRQHKKYYGNNPNISVDDVIAQEKEFIDQMLATFRGQLGRDPDAENVQLSIIGTILHEVQHAIQGIEGFGRGGSADALTWADPAQRMRLIPIAQKILEEFEPPSYELYWGDEDTPEGRKAYAAFLKEWKSKDYQMKLWRAAQEGAPAQLYKMLYGEVEARNVVRRHMMTAEERRSQSPGSTQDVPDVETVVVFNGKEMASIPAVANAAERNLVAVHGMNMNQLEKSLENGKLAGPSLAILPIHLAGDHAQFGEVTLVAKPDAVLPDADSRNKVYETDAYTVTRPDPERDFQAKEFRKIAEELIPSYTEIGDVWEHDQSYSATKNADKLRSSLMFDDGAKYHWLKKRGAKIDIPKMKEPLSTEAAKYPVVQQFMRETPIPDDWGDAEFWKKAAEVAAEGARRNYAKTGGQSFVDAMAEMYLDEDGQLPRRLRSKFERDHRIIRNGRKNVVDRSALRKSLESQIKREGWGEYGAWLDGLIDKAFGPPYLKVGGKKVPYTIDNIVDKMFSNGAKAKEKTLFHNLGLARAKASRGLTSRKAIRERKGAIASKEEVEESHVKIMDRFHATRRHFRFDYAYDRDSMGSMDDFSRAISDYFNGPKTESGAVAALRRNDYKVEAGNIWLSDFMNLADEVLNAPVPYFEAQPQRAVAISEFSGAVVPRGTKPETVQKLKDAGLEVRFYAKGNNEQRGRAVERIARRRSDPVLFSKPPTQEGELFGDATGKKRSALEEYGTKHPDQIREMEKRQRQEKARQKRAEKEKQLADAKATLAQYEREAEFSLFGLGPDAEAKLLKARRDVAVLRTELDEGMFEDEGQGALFSKSVRMYHGGELNADDMREHEHGRATYITDRESEAARYAKSRGRVHEVAFSGKVLDGDAKPTAKFVRDFAKAAQELGYRIDPGQEALALEASDTTVAIQELDRKFSDRRNDANAVLMKMGYSAESYREESGALTYAVFDQEAMQFDPDDPSILHSKPFYSQLRKVADDKLPGKGSGLQFAQMFEAWQKGGQFKPEEYEWSGLDEWLKTQGKITKQDVLDFLDQNEVKIEEVVKGGMEPGLTPDPEWARDFVSGDVEDAVQYFDDRIEEIRNNNPEETNGLSDRQVFLDMIPLEERRDGAEEAWREWSMWESSEGYHDTLFDKYTLPGGENYRELLLTLPRRIEAAPVDTKGWSVQTLTELSTGQREVRVLNAEGKWLLQRSATDLTDDQLIEAAAKQIRDMHTRTQQEDSQYVSAHWRERNVIAHIRFNDRIGPDGERILLVEEFQSDWHQEGREQGYKTKPISESELKKLLADEGYQANHNGVNWVVTSIDGGPVPNKLGGLEGKTQFARDLGQVTGIVLGRRDLFPNASDSVPDAPFKNWWELAFKRALRWAVENGYDGIAWTFGDVQKDRYSLSKYIQTISYNPKTGILRFQEKTSQPGKGAWSRVDEKVEPKKLPDYVGKEIARKIMEREGAPLEWKIVPRAGRFYLADEYGETVQDPYTERAYVFDTRAAAQKTIDETSNLIKANGTIEIGGVDLKVGGEGKNRLYDETIVWFANKYVKKWGAKAGTIGIQTGETSKRLEDMTAEERSAFMRGDLPYDRTVQVHHVPITEQMRESVMAGQPLFSRKTRQQVVEEENQILDLVLENVTPEFKERVFEIQRMKGEASYDPSRDNILAEKGKPLGTTLHEMGHRMFIRYAPDELHAAMIMSAGKMDEILGRTSIEKVLERLGGKRQYESEPERQRYETPAKWIKENYDRSEFGFEMEAEIFRLVGEAKANAHKVALAIAERLKKVFPDEFAQWTAKQIADMIFGAYKMAQNIKTKFGSEGAQYRSAVADFLTGNEWTKHDPDRVAKLRKMDPNTKSWFVQLGMDVWKTNTDFSEWVREMKRRLGEQGEDAREIAAPYLPMIYRGVKEAMTGEEQNLFDVPFVMDPETRAGKFVRYMQDRFNRVLNLEAAIKRAGGTVTDDTDTYVKEELHYGKIEYRLEKVEEGVIKPLGEMIAAAKKQGVTELDIFNYLYAMHAPERNAYVARINPGMPDGGSGWTNEDARRELARLKDKEKILLPIAELVWGINRQAREILKKDLETADRVQVWEEMFEHYVPLRNGDDPDKPVSFGGARAKGFSIRGREKSITGRMSEAENIIEHSISNLMRAIVAEEKNEVGKSLLYLAKQNPNPKFWKVDKYATMQVVGKDGTVKTVPNPKYKDDPNVIVVRVKGVDHVIEVADPVLARQLKRMYQGAGDDVTGLYVKVAGKITRWTAAVNTAYTPEFVLTNFTRDIQAAVANVAAEKSVGLAKKMTKDAARMIPQLWGHLLKDKTNNASGWYARYKAAGGKVGYYSLETVSDLQRKMEKQVERFAKPGNRPFAAVADMAEATLGVVSDVNEAVENATRLAVFKNLVESGVSEQQAASYAKNLTVNFNRKGELGQALNATYAFFNAALQGTFRVGKMLGTKRGKQISTGLAFLGFLNNILNRMIAGDDDDEVNFYDKVPEYKKDTNWLLMTGNKNEHLSLPLPYGLNFFYAIGQYSADLFMGADPLDVTKRALETAMTTFNPLGSGPLEQILAPTYFEPGLQIVTNKNFFGGPLRKTQPPYEAPSPQSELYFDSVNPILRNIAQWMNEQSGGSKYRPGKVEELPFVGEYISNPENLEHMVEFVFGGTGKFITNAFQTTTSLISGDKVESRKIPFARRFYAQPDDYVTEQSYRSAVDSYEQYKNELESLDVNDGSIVQWYKDHPWYPAFTQRLTKPDPTKATKDGQQQWITVDHHIKAIRELNKAIKAVKDQDPEAAEKLQEDKMTLIRLFLKEYNTSREVNND